MHIVYSLCGIYSQCANAAEALAQAARAVEQYGIARVLGPDYTWSSLGGLF
jgi:hypothetical protein